MSDLMARMNLVAAQAVASVAIGLPDATEAQLAYLKELMPTGYGDALAEAGRHRRDLGGGRGMSDVMARADLTPVHVVASVAIGLPDATEAQLAYLKDLWLGTAREYDRLNGERHRDRMGERYRDLEGVWSSFMAEREGVRHD